MSNKLSFTQQTDSLFPLLNVNLHQTHDVINTLERKAQSNFTVVSAVAAALALIHVEFIRLSSLETAAHMALLVFAGSYLLIAWLSICAIWPRAIDLCPLEPTTDNIADLLDEKDERAFRFELMSQYVNIYNSHLGVMECKRKHEMRSYYLVAVAILAVVIELLVYLL